MRPRADKAVLLGQCARHNAAIDDGFVRSAGKTFLRPPEIKARSAVTFIPIDNNLVL